MSLKPDDLVEKVKDLSETDSVVGDVREEDAAVVAVVKAALLKAGNLVDDETANKLAITLISDDTFMESMKDEVGKMQWKVVKIGNFNFLI